VSRATIILPSAQAITDEPCISVVVPAYNEEEVIAETHRRLDLACKDAVREGETYEIVYVNDGSKDKTWSMLQKLAKDDPSVVAVNLSRNFGHQLALTAGLTVARGEYVLCIDADLQDPPELLKKMRAEIDNGADVVYGQRESRAGETKFKLATASAFYRLLERMTDVSIPVDTGDFRLMRRPVVDALLAMPEQHRFVRGLVAWLGFRQKPLGYARDKRFAGETKYPLKRMLKLATDAITGFSVVPLRFATWFAVVSMLVALGVGGYAVFGKVTGAVIPGWTSLAVLVAFLSAAQLFCLGILGEYLGRLFMESKRRPLALVQSIESVSWQLKGKVTKGNALGKVSQEAVAPSLKATDSDASAPPNSSE
jgi:polyisoprenyl-phosphate glycosyltransferase